MLFVAAGQQLYHFPSAGNLGLMGDQPDMDRFGAGGAGGHAPFGLPKGVKPLPYPITMSDTTYMVSPPRTAFVPAFASLQDSVPAESLCSGRLCSDR
jgi:hypothetical protein